MLLLTDQRVAPSAEIIDMVPLRIKQIEADTKRKALLDKQQAIANTYKKPKKAH